MTASPELSMSETAAWKATWEIVGLSSCSPHCPLSLNRFQHWQAALLSRSGPTLFFFFSLNHISDLLPNLTFSDLGC